MTAGVLTAAVAVLYGRTLRAYFFEDDFQWLASTWTFRAASLLDLRQHTHFYRPVIELYFAWGPRLFGHGAAWFHAFSIAVHVCVSTAVYLLARRLIPNAMVAVLAALIFAVMPGYVHAVAWVGAIAEPLVTLFTLISVIAFLAWRDGAGATARILSIGAFAAALLTHESAAVAIVLLAASDWAIGRPASASTSRRRRSSSLGAFLPYVALLVPYLLIALVVSRQNYVVQEGHYRAGTHIAMNALNYLISLYVGKRTVATYVAIVIAVPLIFIAGSRVVKFSLIWIFVTLLPFVFFTWGNTSRYVYTPSVGFALLVGAGLSALDRALAARLGIPARTAVVASLGLAIAIRFAVFANMGVTNFVADTEAYREYLGRFRSEHASLPPGANIAAPPFDATRLRATYVEAMIRWEYNQPDITLTFPAP